MQQPLACSECDRLFCSVCINTWHLRKKECPHCRQKSEMRRVSRILLKQLNKVKFKCADESCRVNFTLEDAKKHKPSCNRKVKVECKACLSHTIKCRNQVLESTIKQHLNVECARRQGHKCFECKKILTSQSIKTHLCVKMTETKLANHIKTAAETLWN